MTKRAINTEIQCSALLFMSTRKNNNKNRMALNFFAKCF